MVRIGTTQVIKVHGHLRMVNKPLKELTQQIHIKITNAGACVLHSVFKPRPARKIDDRARHGFIERHIGMAVSIDTSLIAQGFRYGMLKRALGEAEKASFSGTDEAALVERLGIEVSAVPGERSNIKITTPEDIRIAEAYLDENR